MNDEHELYRIAMYGDRGNSDLMRKRIRDCLASAPPAAATVPEPCPNAAHMGEHACTNRQQCWEPCGKLGHSAEHVRVFHPAAATEEVPDERKAFEQHWRDLWGDEPVQQGSHYTNDRASVAWDAWQARAALSTPTTLAAEIEREMRLIAPNMKPVDLATPLDLVAYFAEALRPTEGGELPAAWIEQVAREWDECHIDAPGGEIEVGPALRRQLRALARPTPAAAAGGPPGYVLVPREPTPEMVQAYLTANGAYWKRTDELPKRPDKWRTGTPVEATIEGYRAMLAASGAPAATWRVTDAMVDAALLAFTRDGYACNRQGVRAALELALGAPAGAPSEGEQQP